MRPVVAEPAGKFWDNGKSPRTKVKLPESTGLAEVRAMVVHQCERRGWSMTTHYSTLNFQGLEHEVCSSGYSYSELRTLAIGPAELACWFSQFADGTRRFYRAERLNWSSLQKTVRLARNNSQFGRTVAFHLRTGFRVWKASCQTAICMF